MIHCLKFASLSFAHGLSRCRITRVICFAECAGASSRPGTHRPSVFATRPRDSCRTTRWSAVGSRAVGVPQAAQQSFADRFGAARAHGSYEELAADPDVDVIYVATPHSRHLEDVLLCFEAGKAVLCEKALTMNLADAETLVAEARSRGLFFAEAMWMRTNPNIRRVAAARPATGACGTIGQVRAELGFVGPADDRPPVGSGARARVRCSTSASTR